MEKGKFRGKGLWDPAASIAGDGCRKGREAAAGELGRRAGHESRALDVEERRER